MGQFLYPPPDVRQPVVIVNDGGGLVDQYERAAWRYRLERRRVEIRGSCRSACTLALSVPNVCVGRGAVVKWHHAYNVDTHEPRYDITKSMLAQLPMRIQYQVGSKITIDYNPNATLTYTQLVALGVADCDAPSPTVVASVTTAPTQASAPAYTQDTNTAAEPQAAEDSADVKKREFDEAYADALRISKNQIGRAATIRNCNSNRCEEIAAYYDKYGKYVELHKGVNSENRFICRLRQEGIFEDTYECTNWMTGEKIKYKWSRDPLY